MSSRIVPIGLALWALAAGPGCALNRHRTKTAPAAAAVSTMLPVGEITLVNEGERFVLIDNGNLPAPPIGGALKSYTAGVESGDLVATNVRRRPFTIADIKSGTPLKGDRVIYLRLPPKPAEPAAKPAEEPKPEEPKLEPPR